MKSFSLRDPAFLLRAAGGSGGSWTSVASTQAWQSICCSDDGSIVAACVKTGYIWVSTNSGVTWTQYATSKAWQAICCDSTGQHLYAAISSGGIYKSSDYGVTWTATAAPSGEWLSITCSSDGSIIYAGGANDDHVLTDNFYTSTDSGATWDSQTVIGTVPDFGAIPIYGVDCSTDGSIIYVAPGGAESYGANQLYASTNSGADWSVISASPALDWFDLACNSDGTCFIAGSGETGGLVYSQDSGATVTADDVIPPGSSPFSALAVCLSDDGSIMAVAMAANKIQISTNSGSSWALVASAQTWTSIACSRDGTKRFACVNGGYIYTSP